MRVLGFAAVAAVVGVVDAMAARLLMRGVAVATLQTPGFGPPAPSFIVLTFVVCALLLGVTAGLTARRRPHALAGALGTAALALLSLRIGSQELVVASLLSGLRRAALVACTLGIVAVVVAQRWLVLRAIRLVERSRLRPAAAPAA